MWRTLTSGLRPSGVTKSTLCCIVLLFVFRFHSTQAISNNPSTSGVTVSSVDSQSANGADESDSSSGTIEKGMLPFFDLVKSFLLVVQPNQISEQSWLNLSNLVKDGDFRTDELQDWKNWAKYLVGFIVCGAVGILFFIIMPITGLVFCCCRCCGKCGGKTKPHDPKRAGCKRKSYCTLLLVFSTLALAGVVCTFLSNEILRAKLQNEDSAGPVGKLLNTADHVNGFINTTIDDVQTSVLDAFVRAQSVIVEDVKNSADNAVDNVLSSVNATSLLQQAKSISDDMSNTQQALMDVSTQLNTLSVQGTWLEANLTAIRDNLTTECAGNSCGTFNPGNLAVSANFSSLGEMSQEINDLAKSANLSQYVTDANATIEQSKQRVSESVNSSITQATDSVSSVEMEIRKGVEKFKTDLQSSTTSEMDRFRSTLQDSQVDITKYSNYVWYAGLGISCTLLIVVVLYYVGVLFGLCGERPGEGAQCCNTGTGAAFLMAGVGVTFLLTWIIMLACTLLFLTGGVMYTEVCQYFGDHNPQELKPFSDAVLDLADFNKNLFDGKNVNLDLVSVLEGCRNDSSIYETMRLENMVNISTYTDLSSLRNSLDTLKGSTFNVQNITILTSDMNQSIYDFADFGVNSTTLDQYYVEVNKNLTTTELPVFATGLRTVAQQLPSGNAKKMVLEENANQLDNLNRDLVVPMTDSVTQLRKSLDILRDLPQLDLKSKVGNLVDGLKTAEDEFNSKKTEKVKEQLVDVVDRVIMTADAVVQGILRDVHEKIGKCRPVYDAFYSATDAVCVVVLDPANGLWFSIGWCLFFFVPSLIFAVKLAGLYRREVDEDFDDPNFMLRDGYKQDGIPLTSSDYGQRHSHYDRDRGLTNTAFSGDGIHSSPGPRGVNPAYQRDIGHSDRRMPPDYSYPMNSAYINGNGREMDHYKHKRYQY